MQIVLDTSTVAAVLGVLGGGLSTAGLSYAVVIRPLRAMLAEFRLLREDWYGEAARPGVPARAGVMERLASIDDQMRTNGGASLRDAVGRIETGLAQHVASHNAAAQTYPPAA